MKKKIITLLLATCFALSVTGCGENKDLTKYRKEMDEFFADIEIIHNKMNTIDAESEVPEEFSSLESLADEASENMSLAVENYHDAYSKDSYNEYTAATADEYYARANKRLQYMIDILHGKMPEGDGVTITEE